MNDIHFSFRNTLFERGLSVDEDEWSRSGYRLKTEDSDLKSAIESYQALMLGFRNMGHYEVAGELFYRKMICRKNILTLREDLFEWIWMRLFYLSCGFGERPINVIYGSILTILLFMDFYLPFVKPYGGWNEWFTAFLLSIDAFTPGKFLDIQFKSIGDLLVQVETILGWFMLSLFLLVFTRKMIRS